jgi:hypothetical protein
MAGFVGLGLFLRRLCRGAVQDSHILHSLTTLAFRVQGLGFRV